jgi:hypothetical protein
MSTSLANYSIHMDQQQQHHHHQQQLQQIHSNLVKSPQLILTRSNSTSTTILDEEIRGEQIHLPASRLGNRSLSLRSLLKTSGLFNKDMESSDKLNELFADGNQFTLHRLLSDFGVNDMNIDMTDLVKFDPMKLLDVRSISEFVSGKEKTSCFFLPLNYEIIAARKKTLSLSFVFF